jgi:predicted nucleotidyltransferase
MARKNFRGYLQGNEVRLKKYFYVLRPLLAVRWVEAGKGVPPMRFAELLVGSELDAPLRQEIDDLLERKQRAGEAEYGLRRPLLHAFIREELARGETPPVLPDSREGDVRELDRLLMSTVMRRA